jgi:hypothetical protein
MVAAACILVVTVRVVAITIRVVAITIRVVAATICVMAGLDPATHDFGKSTKASRGWPGQARP